jgi:peptidoglycan/LPS O-acetylase OafA/YrhL
LNEAAGVENAPHGAAHTSNASTLVSKSIRHIPSLDGLRAVSFLLVFVSHAGLERYVPGGLGVTIFFFLSGFLITTLLRAEFEKNGAISIRHFWLRRTLRILPPFYLVLAGALLIGLALDPPGTLSPPAVVAQALQYTNYWIITHGYEGQPSGTGVYWSLAVEEHFYLVFPWLFIALQRLKFSARQQAAILWSLCVVVLLWRLVLVFVYHVQIERTYLASDTRVDSILFGCALAVWNNPVLDEMPMCERRWKYAYVPLAALLLGFCLLVRGANFRETLRYSLQGVALTVLFIAAIRYHRWPVFAWLNTRVMVYIGLLSYSLYLLHLAVIFGIARGLPNMSHVLRGTLSLAISIALAWLIYVTVEKPCARLRRKLSD